MGPPKIWWRPWLRPPKTTLGGNTGVLLRGQWGDSIRGTAPQRAPKEQNYGGGAGVNPQKPPWEGLHCCGNTLKCTGGARGGSGSTGGFGVLRGPTRAPPLSAQGVQVHLDPLASAEHPHGGEEPPGGDPDLPAPHDRPVPREEHLGGTTRGSPPLWGAGRPVPPKNQG